MHEIPVAFVSHKTKDRIRLKFPSKRKDHTFFARLSEDFLSVKGIESVNPIPLTGSVLVLHTSDPDRIIETLVAKGCFTLEQKAFVQANIQGRLSETFTGIDHIVRDVSGNELDIGGTAFLILLAAGIYQIARGNVTAIPWYAAGWYALNIFLKSGDSKAPAA